MRELVARFREHLEVEKRASANTVRAYLGNVEELAAFVAQKRGRDATCADLDIPTLRSYLASLFDANSDGGLEQQLQHRRSVHHDHR